MQGFIAALLSAEAHRPVFGRGRESVSFGEIRELARCVELPDGEGPIFLHVTSAAHLCAGVLAAAAEDRAIALPAHAQPAYLAEIGASGELVTDAAFKSEGRMRDLDIKNSDPMLFFFTSGSTGAPKRVAKNLERLERETAALDSMWNSDTGHVVATVSHQHIYGLLYRIVWPLMTGRTSDDAAANYWEDLEGRLAGSTLISSPSHLARLSPRRELYAGSPDLIFSSGQLLSWEAAQDCAATFGKSVIEVLGSTETGGIAWRRQTAQDAPWAPLPGVDVRADAEGALSVLSPFLQEHSRLATGDVIEPLAGGAFRLKPRGDRVVKIDGKRVSLTRVEEALGALPEVVNAAALTLETRKGALAAVVALSAEGGDALRKDGGFRLSRRLRAMLSPVLEPAERPKHWRFVDEIPTDAQGKRVLSVLRAMFDQSPLDALDLDVRERTPEQAEIAFSLPDDLIYFKGHFPERPILPGLAQVHLAVLIAQRLWGGWPSDSNLARLKFRRVLTPGDTVLLRLKWDAGAGRLRFSYQLGEIEAANGEIGGFTR